MSQATRSRAYKLAKELKGMSDNLDFFAKDGVEFDADEDCLIWTTIETAYRGWKPLCNSAGFDNHPIFERFLKKHKLFAEPYDSGTLLIYNA